MRSGGSILFVIGFRASRRRHPKLYSLPQIIYLLNIQDIASRETVQCVFGNEETYILSEPESLIKAHNSQLVKKKRLGESVLGVHPSLCLRSSDAFKNYRNY